MNPDSAGSPVTLVHLAPESVEAIARCLLELQRNQPADADPWFTREQAEKHLNMSRTSFFQLRQQFPDELKPCSDHPLRWSRSTLDTFKFRRGAKLPPRRGRKPGQGRIAA